MSDKPISVGDLVAVVRPAHCGSTAALGQIFRVTKIRPRHGWSKCLSCGAMLPPGETVAESDLDEFITEINRLKRIPPLGELEGEKTKEPIHEPA